MEMQKTFVNFKIEKAHDDGSVTFRLTEKKIDRYGEVVLPEGALLDNFKANPIILYSHGMSSHGSIPIGRAVPESIKQTSKAITAKIIFDDDGSDPFATMIAGKVKKGFLNTGSIGFRPVERSEDPVLPRQTGITHKIWELLEYSITPIPALPSALALREFSEVRDEVENKFGSVAEFDECINKFYEMDKEEKGVVEDFLGKFQESLDGVLARISALEEKFKEDPVEDPVIEETTEEKDSTEQNEFEELLTVWIEFKDSTERALKSLTHNETGDENGS